MQLALPEPMPLATLEQLLAQVADGGMDAFARLYDVTSGRLFAIAFRILRDEAVAQDATQEAYVNIWRKAKLYTPLAGARSGG
jgi:RNA polymerase sigma-70 factor (ECF subfamily)